MKTNWERTHVNEAIDADTALRMIRPIFPNRRLAAMHVLGGGLCNTNIRLELDGPPHYAVLRIYNRGADICERERRLAELLRGRVPVPEVYGTDETRSVCDKPYMLMEWVEGVRLSEIMLAGEPERLAEAAASAGAALAAIQACRFPAAGFFAKDLSISEPMRINPRTFTESMQAWLFAGHSGRWLGPGAAETLWDFANRHAGMLTDTGQARSLVHGDFNGLNILVDASGGLVRLSAILDWEFAFAGTPLFDIGNMLRYEPAASRFAKTFMQSYAQHGGALPEQWLPKAKLLDLMSLCSMLDHEACGKQPVKVSDIARLIRMTIAEWDRFQT